MFFIGTQCIAYSFYDNQVIVCVLGGQHGSLLATWLCLNVLSIVNVIVITQWVKYITSSSSCCTPRLCSLEAHIKRHYTVL